MLGFIIFYLIGCFVSYISLNRSKTYCEPDEEWTNYDRKMCLFYSIFSWIGVLTAICVTLIFFKERKKDNKPSIVWTNSNNFFNEHIVPFLKIFEKKEK